MRKAGFFSAGFHILILLLAIFGLPLFDPQTELPPEALPVELAPISEITNIPQKKQKPVEEPKQTPKPKAATPPPKPEPAPEPEAEPVPPPPDETKKAEEIKPEPPKPPERVAKLDGPKPKKKPKKKPEEKFDLNRIAALLDKTESAPDPAEEDPEAKPDEAPTPERPSLSDQMSLSEIDSIRVQIENCWIVPAGARYAENLIVEIRIFLQPDGSLSRPPEVVDRLRMSMPGEEAYRAAAESAIRAVQKCAPLQNLPPDKYDRWRDIELKFDPRTMLGG